MYTNIFLLSSIIRGPLFFNCFNDQFYYCPQNSHITDVKFEGQRSLLPKSKNLLLSLFHWKFYNWAWEDGSEVKSTGCFSRGPKFGSPGPHGSSHPFVTPIPRHVTSSFDYCMNMVHRYTCR